MSPGSRRRLLPSALALSLALATASQAAGETERHFFTISSGQPGGIYYPLARAICDLVNRNRSVHGYRCSVDPTQGSIENVMALRSRQGDFAIVQSDVIRQSYDGEGRWQGMPDKSLREVFSLYTEVATILVRAGHARQGDDLLGLRVNVGPPASGGRATFSAVVSALGRQANARANVSEYDVRDGNRLLCESEIDVSILVVGHPSTLVAEALSLCNLSILSVDPSTIEAIVAAHPYYRAAEIPGRFYGLPSDVQSFGVTAILVAMERTPNDLAQLVAATILDHLPELKARLAILGGTDTRDLLSQQTNIPRHPAVESLLGERKLLSE